jgi:hypothetical protein
MEPPALLPLRRKVCCEFLSPLEIHCIGLNPRPLSPVASTLTTTPPRRIHGGYWKLFRVTTEHTEAWWRCCMWQYRSHFLTSRSKNDTWLNPLRRPFYYKYISHPAWLNSTPPSFPMRKNQVQPQARLANYVLKTSHAPFQSLSSCHFPKYSKVVEELITANETSQQLLVAWSDQGGFIGRDIKHAQNRWGMSTKF